MKPKLLILTSTFPRWRDDTDPPFVFHLAKRLTDKFEVAVHTPHYPGAEREEKMLGITVFRFRYFIQPLQKLAGATGIIPTLREKKIYYLILPFFLIAQFCSLLILIRKIRPNIIHANWVLPQGFFAILVKKLFGISVVVTAHGTDIYGLRQKIFRFFKFLTLKEADRVTVVSQALKSRVQDICPDLKLDILPMGVNSKKFYPMQKDRRIGNEFNLLFVGRLTAIKGVEYLIDALPDVIMRFPKVNLVIIGDGDLREYLVKYVQEKKLGKYIVFKGGIPNSELPKYYARSDIFIGPSINLKEGEREGFGLTFVEAAMAGCLIIGTKTGGISDVIQDNVTGFLVPEKDSEALADKLIYVMEHWDAMREIREVGRTRCLKRFDWEVIAKGYADIFELVLNKDLSCST